MFFRLKCPDLQEQSTPAAAEADSDLLQKNFHICNVHTSTIKERFPANQENKTRIASTIPLELKYQSKWCLHEKNSVWGEQTKRRCLMSESLGDVFRRYAVNASTKGIRWQLRMDLRLHETHLVFILAARLAVTPQELSLTNWTVGPLSNQLLSHPNHQLCLHLKRLTTATQTRIQTTNYWFFMSEFGQKYVDTLHDWNVESDAGQFVEWCVLKLAQIPTDWRKLVEPSVHSFTYYVLYFVSQRKLRMEIEPITFLLSAANTTHTTLKTSLRGHMKLKRMRSEGCDIINARHLMLLTFSALDIQWARR